MDCLLPQYQLFTWVMAMIALASFLKLNYLIKTAILIVMVCVYTTLMLRAFQMMFKPIAVSVLSSSL